MKISADQYNEYFLKMQNEMSNVKYKYGEKYRHNNDFSPGNCDQASKAL